MRFGNKDNLSVLSTLFRRQRLPSQKLTFGGKGLMKSASVDISIPRRVSFQDVIQKSEIARLNCTIQKLQEENDRLRRAKRSNIDYPSAPKWFLDVKDSDKYICSVDDHMRQWHDEAYRLSLGDFVGSDYCHSPTTAAVRILEYALLKPVEPISETSRPAVISVSISDPMDPSGRINSDISGTAPLLEFTNTRTKINPSPSRKRSFPLLIDGLFLKKTPPFPIL
jgi:hypothetical protein